MRSDDTKGSLAVRPPAVRKARGRFSAERLASTFSALCIDPYVVSVHVMQPCDLNTVSVLAKRYRKVIKRKASAQKGHGRDQCSPAARPRCR